MKQSNVLAFIGGAIARAAVALLLAPKKGGDLRHDIKAYVEKEVKRGKKQIKEAIDEVLPAQQASANIEK